jgi:hypothetical protein
MEPDDLLCSRNARSEKTLVGRAQWKINQPPSLKITSELGREEKGSLMVSCARATRGLGRPSLDTRSGRPIGPPFREKRTSKLGGSICSEARGTRRVLRASL